MATFNAADHLILIKGNQYLPVQWRLVAYRMDCPSGGIRTEMIHLDMENKFCIFRAEITDGRGGSATATKQESARDFPDFIEKAETGAIGRALAMLGYGTQWVGLEFDEAGRLADAPVQALGKPPIDEPIPTPTPPSRPCGIALGTQIADMLNKLGRAPIDLSGYSREQGIKLLKSLNDEFRNREEKPIEAVVESVVPNPLVEIPMATEEQRKAIQFYCEKQKRAMPEGFSQMSSANAAAWIAQQQSNPQHQQKRFIGFNTAKLNGRKDVRALIEGRAR